MQTDLMAAYIIAAYLLVFLACVVGSFNHRYEANTMQSLALAMLGFWCVWRIKLVWNFGWGIPHEPLLATALLCHSIGSVTKTMFWKERK
jgi:energy-coupling factor transporter transmembrane protein EcfT